jgi:hypothetical protein
MLTWFKSLDSAARTIASLFVTAIVLCFVLAVLTMCTARQDAARERANTKAVSTNSRVIERSAEDRLTSTLNSNAREKERSDATASLPDARPSDRRLARACVQLRQQGSQLPPVCR